MLRSIRGLTNRSIRHTDSGLQRAAADSRSAAPVIRTITRSSHTAVPGMQHFAPVIRKATPAHEHEVWHLARECIIEFRKIAFDSRLRANLERLERTYATHLKAAANDEYLKMDVRAIDGSPLTLAMALAWDLATFLEWVTTNYFEDFNLDKGRLPLEKVITPRHLRFLTESFRETFDALPERDRRKLVMAIDAEALNRLECQLNPEERRLQSRSIYIGDGLSFDEVIAKVDYCHVDTGQFNVVNSAQRLSSYAGIPITTDIVSCVSESMNRGLRKLMRNEDFIFRGHLFKGINTSDPAGPYRRSRLIDGNIWVVPHATSATSDPDWSYANPPTYPAVVEPRDTNLIFVDAWGVQVHLFNYLTTVCQKEVLIMPTMAFRGIPEPSSLAGDRRPNRKHTFYCELDPDHSGYTLGSV